MPRPWPDKFRSAFRGIWLAFATERSFTVHLPATAAVLIAGAVLRVSLLEGCILALCVALVLSAEIFNTSLEFLSREVTRDERPGIAAALDMASGAVLLATLFAAGVGGSIFLARLTISFGWWK